MEWDPLPAGLSPTLHTTTSEPTSEHQVVLSSLRISRNLPSCQGVLVMALSQGMWSNTVPWGESVDSITWQFMENQKYTSCSHPSPSVSCRMLCRDRLLVCVCLELLSVECLSTEIVNAIQRIETLHKEQKKAGGGGRKSVICSVPGASLSVMGSTGAYPNWEMAFKELNAELDKTKVSLPMN